MVKANHALSNSALGNHPWHNFVRCEAGWTCSVNDRCVTVKIQQTEKKKKKKKKQKDPRYTLYPVEGGLKQT